MKQAEFNFRAEMKRRDIDLDSPAHFAIQLLLLFVVFNETSSC